MMSVFGLKPGEMGDSILLSRLEKGSDPVTVHIPTSKMQVMVYCALHLSLLILLQFNLTEIRE